MTRDELTPPDAGASFMGKYGLKNPTVAWLIGRGLGEVVALRPGEMVEESAPKCPSKTRRGIDWQAKRYITVDEPCPMTMKSRPAGWVCYEHDVPVRVPRQLPIEKIPEYAGGIERALDKIVDLEYASPKPGVPAAWLYRTRRFDS